MKTLLIVYSYHHNNTLKIAEVFSKTLEAEIVEPQQANPQQLLEYDLVGFGSGIDSRRHYKPLLDFADSLPLAVDKKAFIFSTSGIAEASKNHSELREKLLPRGYVIVGEFNCRGFNTNSFLKYFGGMNKGRHNEEDLKNAKEFAENIKKNI